MNDAVEISVLLFLVPGLQPWNALPGGSCLLNKDVEVFSRRNNLLSIICTRTTDNESVD